MNRASPASRNSARARSELWKASATPSWVPIRSLLGALCGRARATGLRDVRRGLSHHQYVGRGSWFSLVGYSTKLRAGPQQSETLFLGQFPVPGRLAKQPGVVGATQERQGLLAPAFALRPVLGLFGCRAGEDNGQAERRRRVHVREVGGLGGDASAAGGVAGGEQALRLVRQQGGPFPGRAEAGRPLPVGRRLGEVPQRVEGERPVDVAVAEEQPGLGVAGVLLVDRRQQVDRLAVPFQGGGGPAGL